MKKKPYIPFWLKLFAIYSLVIVSTFTIILAGMFPRIIDHSKSEVQSQLDAQSAHVIQNLEYQLDTMRSIYIKLKIDSHLQEAFQNTDPALELEAQDYISEKIATLSNIWGRAIYILIYDCNAETFYNSTVLSSTAMADPTWMNELDKSHSMFSFRVINDRNSFSFGTRSLFIGDVIRRDLFYEKLAYFSVNVNLNELESMILMPDFTPGTLQILTDNEGAYVLGDEVLPTDFEPIPDQGVMTLGDQKYIVSQSTSQTYGFTHYILTPTAEAYGDLDMLLRVMFTTVVFVVLTAIAISLLLARQITNPIHLLTEMVSRYNGDSETQDEIQDLQLKSEFSVLNDRLIQMANKITTLINDVYQQKIIHQQLELQTLYKTINPHFIYNILDTIQWELRLDRKDSAIKTLYAFSHYLRNTLVINQEQKPLSSIKSAIQDYCDLQNIVSDQVVYEPRIPDELGDYLLPSMLVLPLVENSFTHAFPDDFAGEQKITVTARTTDTHLFISVEDTGCGISAADLAIIDEILASPLTFRLEEESTRFFAIKNIQSRIHLSCGNAYGMQISSSAGGTCSTLYLPLVRRQNDLLSLSR